MSIMTKSKGIPLSFHVEERNDKRWGKTLLTLRHESGFTIKYLPYPGFSKKFAALTVPFGSIHTKYQDSKQSETYQWPSGSAHFLEHCLFSRDEMGGLSGRLSEWGASTNAYTTYDHTLYYVSTVHHFQDAFSAWLDALFEPAIDTARVAVERPVILAELDQYQDDPDARCTRLLLESLYHHHPIKEDIGGTRKSVSSITADQLEQIWRIAYHPQNLCLTIAGDIDIPGLLDALQPRLDKRLRLPCDTAGFFTFPQEPDFSKQDQVIQEADLSVPIFAVGVKGPNNNNKTGQKEDHVIRQRAASLVLDTLLSPVSPLYDTLYRKGMINDSFSYDYVDHKTFSFMLSGGESRDPEQAARQLIDGMISALKQGLDTHIFSAQKKSAAGTVVSALDSVSRGGFIQAQCAVLKADLFDYPAIYDKMDARQATQQLAFLSEPDRYVISILKPRR
jgi:predicted Zn-dependent peptidase